MEQFGRPLLILGGVLMLVGLILMLGPKLPFGLGRLNFHWQRGNFNVYFPLGTLLLLNLILALVMFIFNKR
jgi:hypothetical protein